jgi:uncharacterized membrane protein YdfJ with MMPL/SSD domain
METDSGTQGARKATAAHDRAGRPALNEPHVPQDRPKEMGVILGIAVLLDAALVRLLLVPVALRLLGKWAWRLPKPLDRVLPDVRFGNAS